MKVAIVSDIHDNLVRWKEAASIISSEKIDIGICLGDVGGVETLTEISKSFKKLYYCFGNMDYVKGAKGLLPENIDWFEKIGKFELEKRKIAIVHYDYIAKNLAKENKYDLVLYGHTHTPWEEKVRKSILLNPGEIAGQFGRASFAIYDLQKMEAELRILK